VRQREKRRLLRCRLGSRVGLSRRSLHEERLRCVRQENSLACGTKHSPPSHTVASKFRKEILSDAKLRHGEYSNIFSKPSPTRNELDFLPRYRIQLEQQPDAPHGNSVGSQLRPKTKMYDS
jgi:hypothetical protein